MAKEYIYLDYSMGDFSLSMLHGTDFNLGNDVPINLEVNWLPVSNNPYYEIDIDAIFDALPNVGLIVVPYGNSNVAFLNTVNTHVEMNGYYFRDIQSLTDVYGINTSVPIPSLNGNGCEFLDSTQVKVVGRSIVYAVVRSYMGLVSDNSYTALYDCVSATGETLTVPEALLTRYIAPVTTP